MTNLSYRIAKIKQGVSRNIRTAPTVKAADIGDANPGDSFVVLGEAVNAVDANASGKWYLCAPAFWIYDGGAFEFDAVPAPDTPVTPPASTPVATVPVVPVPGGGTGPNPAKPNTASTRPRLGVHAMSNGRLAMQEAAQGCRFFLLMDAFAAASELKDKYPDATVMVRKYFGNIMPSIDDAMRGLEGARDRRLIYTGLNESDAIGTSVREIRERAKFDIALAERIRQASGATYAACTFSMGNPDFTNAEVCAVMRELYAPAYNSGLIAMDMHNYSPDMGHIAKPGEWKWYERRWEFLFTHCGFDPRIRAIYSSEGGVDEGGVGGFPAHRATAPEFADWCSAHQTAQAQPVVVNGVSWPSPFVGCAIFQLGGNQDPRWAGYDITGYLGELRKHY